MADPDEGGEEEPVDPNPDEGEDQPAEPGTAISSSFIDGVASNNFFTAVGSKATKKGTMTINGETYDTGLKLDSKGSISFTPTADMTMTVYYRVKEGKESTPTLNVNDVEVTGTAIADGFIYTASVSANTAYTISKGVEAYVYYIELVPAE